MLGPDVVLRWCSRRGAATGAASATRACWMRGGASLCCPRTPEAAAPAGCPDTAWWRLTPQAERTRTERAIRDASLRYGIDERLIRSVIRAESDFESAAVSHKGAMGLMQLMPATAQELGVACPFDPRENVLGGTRYLRQMRDRLGSWPRALAAYHAGPGSVEQGRIPGVTRRYVRQVLRLWQPERPERPDLG
jgi:soluble lytic murein transglycosylase-like protein